MFKKIAPFFLVVSLLLFKYYKEEKNNYFRFEKSVQLSSGQSDYLKFQQATNELGINSPYENLETPGGMMNYKNFIPVTTFVNVVDFNNDGFDDLLFCNGYTRNQVRLYLNTGKGNFIDVTEASGLNKSSLLNTRSAVTFFDYDNDGYKDVIMSSRGFLTLFHNEHGKYFKDVSSLVLDNQFNSLITSIRVIDFDRDGWPDLYVSSLFRFINMGKLKLGYFAPVGNKKDFSIAGPNYLLHNLKGEGFERVIGSAVAANNQLAWDATVMDVNGDGWLDLIVANDFSINRVYENNRKGDFVETTKYRAPNQYTSSNMGISSADVNGDGLLDFFVTNVSRSTYTTSNHNHLFLQNEGHQYEDLASDYGVKRCGWGWGSQFADLDKDGTEELIMSNGYFDDGKKDYYYHWITYASLPPFFISNPKVLPPTQGYHLSSNERNCLFKKDREDHFVDVAASAGLDDLKNGRGVALFDLNNTGSLSIAISNYEAAPIIYKNISKKSYNWIGVTLEGKSSGKDAFGSVLYLKHENGKQVKYFNPSQGFSSQTTAKVIFGLKDLAPKTAELEVHWSSGRVDTYKDLKLNAYNKIVEKE